MTRHGRSLVLPAFAAAMLCAASAAAQTPPQNAPQNSPQSLADAYRGMFVCEKASGAADILHVPVDVAVRGDNVQFARPLFNLRGTRVVGSELGAGTVDPTGKVHVTSEWTFRGISVHGDYGGTLSQSGGTFTGTQSWRGPDGEAHSRTCQAALVPAPNKRQASAQ